MEETLVPITLFAMAPLIVWAVVAYRHKNKKAVMGVLDTMIQKGESVTPDTIYALGIRPRSRHADLRTGVILIALALGTFTLGFTIGDPEAIRAFSGVSIFPLLIGVAYVGLWVFIGRKSPDNIV